MNKLILGDNLEIMRKMDSETIDLIYLDPPFFSNRNYEVIWGDKGEIRSFEDRWSGGIDHYIAWLKERVAEMHRILKPSGSIYLHCDWHANAYIRVYVLDKIFGENNFRNEIIWRRTGGHNKSDRFAPIHDTIHYYSKSNKFKWNNMKKPYMKGHVEKNFAKDEKGYKTKYYGNVLTGSGIRKGESGMTWKGFNPTEKNRHWAIPKAIIEEIEEDVSNLTQHQKLDLLYERGFIKIIEGQAWPIYERYLNLEKEGQQIPDIWAFQPYTSGTVFGTKLGIDEEIRWLATKDKERIGYPTQKPEKLLNRIILASSNEGDIVFDPFLGGGTTVVVADRLNRQWLGIDQSVQAIKVSEIRLNKQQNLFSADFTVQLHKYDYDTLRYKDAFEFETWIIERFDGIANIKQRGDFGMDGRMRSGTPLQVKRSENIGRNVVDNFKSSCQRYDKNLFAKNKANAEPVGYIIAFSFGKGAIQEVARLQNEENIIIKLVEVESIVPIAKKPKLAVELKQISKDAKGMTEIEFTAIAESEAGIEFFAWDFEYNEEEKKFNAGIMLDKEGKQIHKFKPGTHNIAVKAIDNEGLEAIEVVKVKVNGEMVYE